jgi:ankyrin repeat protein
MFGRAGALSALLAAGADVNGGLQAGDVALNGTPLHAAVCTYDDKSMAVQQQMVNILLQHGADIDALDCSGQTPLMLAALNGSVELASMLLAAGAAVGAVCTQWRMTALHYATELCKIGMLELLLQYGADATAVDVNGELPLHGACRQGSVEVCTL